jgi:hypothetical protein
MTLRLRIRHALLPLVLASTCGCGGGQDPDQPAVGSISVKADRGDDTPVVAPGKKAPADPK